MMAIGRRRQLLLAGIENPRRGNFAVTIAKDAAAFPLTEPTLLRTSLASQGGQSRRVLKGRG